MFDALKEKKKAEKNSEYFNMKILAHITLKSFQIPYDITEIFFLEVAFEKKKNKFYFLEINTSLLHIKY